MKSVKPLRVCLLQTWDLDSAPYDWEKLLPSDRFVLHIFVAPDPMLRHIRCEAEAIDCLIFIPTLTEMDDLAGLGKTLCEVGVLLPTLVLWVDRDPPCDVHRHFYHNATLGYRLPAQAGSPLTEQIDRAIGLFLQISPTCSLPPTADNEFNPADLTDRIQQQQRRLAEKLRERLGYAGVYYHRDPARFYRQLSEGDQKAMMQRLRALYQAIVLEYFRSSRQANARIDEFVALAFLGDIAISQVLELHMSLMDDFAKQLQLEGRSDEILLDYRITLIDVIAHLSEMYRLSIPRST